MNEDNKELVEYLDKKFVKIDERFESIDKGFESLLEVFVTKDEFNGAIEKLATKEDLNSLMTSVDAYAVKADKFFQELVMLAHKVDRHEKMALTNCREAWN
jgi:hypothetical protein